MTRKLPADIPSPEKRGAVRPDVPKPEKPKPVQDHGDWL